MKPSTILKDAINCWDSILRAQVPRQSPPMAMRYLGLFRMLLLAWRAGCHLKLAPFEGISIFSINFNKQLL